MPGRRTSYQGAGNRPQRDGTNIVPANLGEPEALLRWGSSQDNRIRGYEDEETAKKSVWAKVSQTAQHLTDLASSVLVARGKLRPIDMIAIGTQGFRVGMNIYYVWHDPEPVDLSTCFSYPGSEWRLTPWLATLHAFEDRDVKERIIDSHKIVKQGKITLAAWVSEVEGVEIGWIGPPDQTSVPTQMWSKTPERIAELAANRLWERAGSDQIIRISGEHIQPYEVDKDIKETGFLRDIQKRVDRFLESGVPRSFLLDGSPGVGKTSSVGYIAKKLGMKTVIVKAEEFMEAAKSVNGEIQRGVDLAEMLKPAVLVINDMDRIDQYDQVALLDVLETAKKYAKLIFVTTNHYRELIEPLRRPGRLDDLVHVPGLSIEEIREISPAAKDLAPRMVGWPVAFVRDFQERYNVLGDLAIKEFDQLDQRLREIIEDGDYEDETAEKGEKEEKDIEELWRKLKKAIIDLEEAMD